MRKFNCPESFTSPEEVKNGARAPRFNRFIEKVISSLTPERISRLADKHNLEPVGNHPWQKGKVGGSDDHSGFFIARAHTVATQGKARQDFIGSISGHQSWAGGEDGDPLTLAHSLYGIGHSFYRSRLTCQEFRIQNPGASRTYKALQSS